MQSPPSIPITEIPTAILVVGGDGAIVSANAHAERLFGYAHNELSGLPLERLIPEHYRARHGRLQEGFLAEPEPRPMGTARGLQGLMRDGKEFPVEIALGPTAGDSLTVAVIRDLRPTEIRGGLRDLDHSFRNTPIGLCYFDKELRYVRVNDWLARINGLSIEEHLGRRIADLLPDVALGVEAQLRHVLQTGESILGGFVETTTPAHPTTTRTYTHNYFPDMVAGTAVGIFCVVQDVTEAKEALDAALTEVQESEARLAGVIDIASDAIISIDKAHRIVLFNQGAERTFGYSAGEVVGRELDLLIPARYQANHRHHLEAFADSASPARQMAERQTVFGRRKDGEEFPAEAAISRLEIDRPAIFTVILRDISERIRMAEEVRRQQAQIAHVGRRTTMGELTAAIAHELNQPLTAIGSNVAAAKRFLAAADPDLKEIREILDDIGDDNRRASEVIRRIRTLLTTRETERTPLDLNETVRQVAELLHGDMMMRNLALELDLDAELPAVVADSIQVQQVLMNLMLNGCEAMESTPQDSRKLIVESLTGERGELARVSVVDRGAGLQGTSPEELFAPFYTRKQDGMGMGLAISRSIVEAHGGRIWGCQNPHRGATFHFTLPASRTA